MARDLVLLAHNIRSLWNVGSFFRTADALGVGKIYLTGYTSTPDRQEVSKTALGAEGWIPWEKVDDPLTVIRSLRSNGYTIVSLELTKNSESMPTYQSHGPACLVIGHEILGVPEDVLRASDVILQIPMSGKKHSLNVSVAAGIALYHLSLICS